MYWLHFIVFLKKMKFHFILLCLVLFFLYWLLLHLIFLFISLFSAVKQFTLFACEKGSLIKNNYIICFTWLF